MGANLEQKQAIKHMLIQSDKAYGSSNVLHAKSTDVLTLIYQATLDSSRINHYYWIARIKRFSKLGEAK